MIILFGTYLTQQMNTASQGVRVWITSESALYIRRRIHITF